MEKVEGVLIEIQDKLVPILDSYEQAIYHYLFRHTFLVGKTSCLYSTRSAEIGLGTGDALKKPSMNTRSKKLRSLEIKGCIEIVERSNLGIKVKLILPSEISHIQSQDAEAKPLELDNLDFFKNKKLLLSILTRENHRCFYTGRKLTIENCYLDHVIPQASGGNNSYKNIVATCYDANSMKNDKQADEFIRLLYKEEIISLSELGELKAKIAKLQSGDLKPDINLVKAAI